MMPAPVLPARVTTWFTPTLISQLYERLWEGWAAITDSRAGEVGQAELTGAADGTGFRGCTRNGIIHRLLPIVTQRSSWNVSSHRPTVRFVRFRRLRTVPPGQETLVF